MTQPPQYGGPPPPPYGYAPPPPPMVFPGGYASWGSRAVAFLLDFVLVLPFLVLFLAGQGVMFYGLLATPDIMGSVVAVGLLLVLAGAAGAVAVQVWNMVFRQGRTGQSWGKGKTRIIVLREADGRPQGPGMSCVRWLLHGAINQALYIDYLWPLWDDRNQTLTDKILDTVVVNLPGSVQPGDHR